MGGLLLFLLCVCTDPGVSVGVGVGVVTPAAAAGGVHSCRRCQHQVEWFDHHCVWMGVCIGRRNMRIFLAFLSFHAALATWGSFVIVRFLGALVRQLCAVEPAAVAWTHTLLNQGEGERWWPALLPRPSELMFGLFHRAMGPGTTSGESEGGSAAVSLRELARLRAITITGGLPSTASLGWLDRAPECAVAGGRSQSLLMVLESQELAMLCLVLGLGFSLWLCGTLAASLGRVSLVSRRFRWNPFTTGCSPLSYGDNPGVTGVSYRGATGKRLAPGDYLAAVAAAGWP